MKAIDKTHERIRRIWPDPSTTAFVSHNRNVWRCPEFSESEGEVLFEYNGMASAVIAYSYLANILREKYRSTLTAYTLGPSGVLSRFGNRAGRQVFRSFGVDRFVAAVPTGLSQKKRDLLFDDVYKQLSSKQDVVDLEIDGVEIGDLLYDEFIRRNGVPTVELDDPAFAQSLKNSLGVYVFWQDYFAKHRVRAVHVSHCVYDYGIVLRVALSLGIPVYQVSPTHAYRMSTQNLWAYNDFYYFREEFGRLSTEKQQEGKELAKERIERRFGGEVGVDMVYSSQSAYGSAATGRVLRESDRTKVFIALHCFFDNPHPYGLGLFTDFYDWLSFLGRISERTDYDWYLKTHPDFLPGNNGIVEGFLERFPAFSLLDPRTSHHQIISDGVDVALTVHGTIGFEYAALGVPVVNASMSNPHVAYNFNHHPQTIEEYEQILLNMPESLEIDIDVDEVYEYYFMRFIRQTENWLFKDYKDVIKRLGGYKDQFTPSAYRCFLKEFSTDRHETIKATLDRFVASGDYCLQDRHFPEGARP